MLRKRIVQTPARRTGASALMTVTPVCCYGDKEEDDYRGEAEAYLPNGHIAQALCEYGSIVCGSDVRLSAAYSGKTEEEENEERKSKMRGDREVRRKKNEKRDRQAVRQNEKEG